ncbi:MAG: hypothetical protein AAGI23_16645 [Bacteroidota bacterium]
MKTKAQKRTEAKKTAEATKAQRKSVRDAKKRSEVQPTGKKGKSLVPQTKKKK